MSKTDMLQPSFAAGELAPGLYARIDLSKYAIGLKKCRNAFVHIEGGVSNRPGKEYISRAFDDSHDVRVVPFSFNTTQTYMLEFGHQYVRFISDGGYVLETAKTITAITQANPAVVTSAAHGYSNGDWVYLTGILGMTELNGDFYVVANKTANTFELKDIFGANINSTSYTAYSSAGSSYRVYKLSTSYIGTDLADLQFSQSADVMTITSLSYAVYELSRVAAASWTLTAVTFAPGISAPGSVTAVATVAAGAGFITHDYKVTALLEETFEESLPGTHATCSNNLSTAGNYNTVGWATVSGAVRYNIYKAKNGVFGFVGVAIGTSFIDNNIDPDVLHTAPEARNPFAATDDYPHSSTYHEQRRVFAGTNSDPQTVWGTQIAAYSNMNVSSPANDSDAFTFTINAREVNAIHHIVSLQDLAVFTSGGEWVMSPGSSGDAIGPNSINVKRQSNWGASDAIAPLVVGDTIIFVQAKGKAIRDFLFDVNIGKYTGSDLTVLAKHLFEGRTVVSWAYSQMPYGIVWVVLSDGKFLSFTYNRENQVWAWARHDTDGYVNYVAVISEGDEDAVYFVVERDVGASTYKFIERLHTRDFINSEDCFFLDSGMTLDMRNDNAASTVTVSGGTNWTVDETLTITENAAASPFVAGDVGDVFVVRAMDDDGVLSSVCRFTITARTSSTVVSATPNTVVPAALRGVATAFWSKTATGVTGLKHLEGVEVSILGDGDVQPTATVASGAVTFVRPFCIAHIGRGYYSDIETLDIGGSPTAPMIGKFKKASKLRVIVSNTRGGSYGPDENKLLDLKQRTTEAYDMPTSLKTGPVDIVLVPNWNQNGRVFIRQADPLPITINGIIPEGDIS